MRIVTLFIIFLLVLLALDFDRESDKETFKLPTKEERIKIKQDELNKIKDEIRQGTFKVNY